MPGFYVERMSLTTELSPEGFMSGFLCPAKRFLAVRGGICWKSNAQARGLEWVE
jgi:hypothetical protein